MLKSPPSARRARRHRRSAAGSRRFRLPFPARDEAREAAQLSRDACERLWAGALETLARLIPSAVAVAFEVDEHGGRRAAMAYSSAGAGGDLDALIRRLARLESIDPFAVRDAEAAGAIVRSAADVGGLSELGRTPYGRHLARHGLRAPLFAYLRRGGRITECIALVRTTDDPDFDASATFLLARLQPLLEDALAGPIVAGAP